MDKNNKRIKRNFKWWNFGIFEGSTSFGG